MHSASDHFGSKAGPMASPGPAAYDAAKASMAHYMNSLSSCLLPLPQLNTLSHGMRLQRTGSGINVRANDSEAYDKVVGRNPPGHLATPDETFRVAVFVSSPTGSFSGRCKSVC